jgi:zinc transport system ATP-binding protein
MMMQSVIYSRDLVVTINGKVVLENITFTVEPGQLLGIIGPNGAGKTTLLRAILGLIPIHSGTLEVLGLPVNKIYGRRGRIGYMPQRQLFERRFPVSVSDVVTTGLLNRGTILRRINGSETKVREALRLVGIEGYRSRPFQDLSGGEQQRVMLARSLVRNPELLLLDEPNAGLDFPAQQDFLDLLHSLQQKKNLAVVLVSHDLLAVASVADSLICINRVMHLHGHPGEVLHSAELKEAYRCQYDFLSTSVRLEGEHR